MDARASCTFTVPVERARPAHRYEPSRVSANDMDTICDQSAHDWVWYEWGACLGCKVFLHDPRAPSQLTKRLAPPTKRIPPPSCLRLHRREQVLFLARQILQKNLPLPDSYAAATDTTDYRQ